MNYRDIFDIDVTLVANDFLDNYMPKANGDYIKVYLYLLRNKTERISISDVAEKLELTEGDVNRALKYWKEQGILIDRIESGDPSEQGTDGAASGTCRESAARGGAGSQTKSAADEKNTGADAENRDTAKRSGSITREQQERLAGDDEFRQLLMIAQKYMSMIFTPREVNILGYLYDTLKLPSDVIDYLIDYCVQGGHNDIRYIEKTGLNWASQGIKSVSAAVKQTKAFDKAKEELIKKNERNSIKAARKKSVNRNDTDYNALVMEQSFLRRIE